MLRNKSVATVHLGVAKVHRDDGPESPGERHTIRMFASRHGGAHLCPPRPPLEPPSCRVSLSSPPPPPPEPLVLDRSHAMYVEQTQQHTTYTAAPMPSVCSRSRQDPPIRRRIGRRTHCIISIRDLHPGLYPRICCKVKNRAMESSPRLPEQPSPCIASSHTTRLPAAAEAHTTSSTRTGRAHEIYYCLRTRLLRPRACRPPLCTTISTHASSPRNIPALRHPALPGKLCPAEDDLPGTFAWSTSSSRAACEYSGTFAGGMRCCSLLAVRAFGGGRMRSASASTRLVSRL